MKKYLENENARRITQYVLTGIQVILMILAITFMYLFVSTGAGADNHNYAVYALVFTIVWCVYYLAQLIFSIATYATTVNRNKWDLAFLIISIVMLPFGCAIYGILIALM